MQLNAPGKNFWAKFGQICASVIQIWAKVKKIWANLIRYGKNQYLASQKNIRSPSAMVRVVACL